MISPVVTLVGYGYLNLIKIRNKFPIYVNHISDAQVTHVVTNIAFSSTNAEHFNHHRKFDWKTLL
jgi:hypothetical protein